MERGQDPRELAENIRIVRIILPKIAPIKQIGKSPDIYTAAPKAEVMKAEKKEPILVVRRMQIEVNEDWSSAQRSDPILAKTIAIKEEKK